ncbi:zinc finger protein 862-like [Dreissena polymorpha]|uniref:zinc finger protein 862-like n=1 Tax=Dreissena polymorpha TaxID=45954 RepID=UPI002264B634|nr:zinc finger protein 862-like [Dreissena polymorpha]
MKTVKKWEKELNIKLKLVVDEDDHVNQMFCEDCVQFMPDQTSSFVTGCTSIKKESVKYHRDSVIHQRGSAKRNREAEEIADLMDTHFTKPERCNGTRWVDHKLRAISKLVTNWKILVMDMMSYSQDDSNAGQYRAKAQGILKKMMQFKFIWFIHFMKDLLTEIAKVSLQFQKEDLILSSVVNKLQTSNELLRHLADNDGDSLKDFKIKLNGDQYEDETLKNVINFETLDNEKGRLVQLVIDCLQSRLNNIDSDPLYLSCLVLDPKNWPCVADQKILLYGNDSIKLLLDHFKSPLLNAGCDIDSAMSEWKDLKFYIGRGEHFKGQNPFNIYQRVSHEDIGREEYTNIMLVIHLTSLYPLSNASCERAFSIMKHMKNDWRYSLSSERMDQLMRIKITGKGEEFNPKWTETQKT